MFIIKPKISFYNIIFTFKFIGNPIICLFISSKIHINNLVMLKINSVTNSKFIHTFYDLQPSDFQL